jgi:ketosteroid isomerase-like protein
MTRTLTFARICGLSMIGALALGGAAAYAKDDPRVADEVIGLARAQWAAEVAGKGPAEQLAAVAEDYTEFNPDYPTLLVGKSLAIKMLGVPQPVTPLFSDLQNARVQVYGDTAILTYNFTGISKAADGKVSANTAKSTRVYVRQDGKWVLVHANFAPVSGN